MKFFTRYLLLSLAMTLAVPQAFAATVKVDWQEPDNYTDVRAPDIAPEKYREHVFKQLDESFTALAAELPSDQTLSIQVTDLNLAGVVEFSHNVNTRVVRRTDFPSIHFSYELLDADSSVVKSGDEELKETIFRRDLRDNHRRPISFKWEKEMIEKWFQDAFPEQES